MVMSRRPDGRSGVTCGPIAAASTCWRQSPKAVEPRIVAFAITSIGCGTVTRLAAAELPPDTEATDRYLRFLEQFDPANSVAVPGRRRLLFQHGRHDPVVRRDESLKLYEAAAEPKDWREYDCGHDPDGDPQAVTDRTDLFSAHPAD
jgi:hypothetical protein